MGASSHPVKRIGCSAVVGWVMTESSRGVDARNRSPNQTLEPLTRIGALGSASRFIRSIPRGSLGDKKYDMSTNSRTAEKRSPIWGMLSVAVPFIGWFLLTCIDALTNDDGLMILASVIIIPLVLILSTVFAIVALVRHEPYRMLSAIGLLIVLAVVIRMFTSGGGPTHF